MSARFFSEREKKKNPKVSLFLSPKAFFPFKKLSSLRGDLLLELLDVGQQFLAARLEQQVAVHEPRGVTQAHELEQLGEERDGVDSADDGRREPEEDDGTSGVEQGRGLVLDGVPLEGGKRGREGGRELGGKRRKGL